MKHTPKKGVGSGVGNTGSFFSSLPAAAPAFPKQQHLQAGAQLEGRVERAPLEARGALEAALLGGREGS